MRSLRLPTNHHEPLLIVLESPSHVSLLGRRCLPSFRHLELLIVRRQYALLALCDDEGQCCTLGSNQVISPSSGNELRVIVAEVERNILSLSLSALQ